MLLVDDLAAGGTKNLRHTPRGLVTLSTEISKTHDMDCLDQKQENLTPCMVNFKVSISVKFDDSRPNGFQLSVSPNHVVCDVNFWYHRQLNHQQEASPRNFNQS